jgi:hypothetical protein
MNVKMYSAAARARLHAEGVDMVFGGGAYVMRPEQADALAFGLVQLDRATGKWRRVQLCPLEERMIISDARGREMVEASTTDRDQPTPWSSGRTPHPRSSDASPNKKR